MSGPDARPITDGWAFVATLAAQCSVGPDPDPVNAFLGTHDPFAAAFEVTYTGQSSVPGVIVDRLGRRSWLVLLENGSEVEADVAQLTPRVPPMTAAPSTVVVPSNPQLVCVDSLEENMVPAMALAAHTVLPESWNGWARPLAATSEVAAFLGRWRANDRNGVWGFAVDLGDALLVTRSDGEEPDYFAPAGCREDGVALFDLTGWVWVALPN